MRKTFIISLIFILFFCLCAGCSNSGGVNDRERRQAIQSEQELLKHIDKLKRIRSWDELTSWEKFKIRQLQKRIDELDEYDPKNTRRIYELMDEIEDILSGDYKKNE